MTVLDGNCSSCGDCSDWKETLMLGFFLYLFVGPEFSVILCWCHLVPVNPKICVFSGRVAQVKKKTRGVFGDHPQNLSFVVNEVLKENHLESSVVM